MPSQSPNRDESCERCGATPAKPFGWDYSMLCEKHFAEAERNVAAAERDASGEPLPPSECDECYAVRYGDRVEHQPECSKNPDGPRDGSVFT